LRPPTRWGPLPPRRHHIHTFVARMVILARMSAQGDYPKALHSGWIIIAVAPGSRRSKRPKMYLCQVYSATMLTGFYSSRDQVRSGLRSAAQRKQPWILVALARQQSWPVACGHGRIRNDQSANWSLSARLGHPKANGERFESIEAKLDELRSYLYANRESVM
jgi:hypothetical protein